MKTWPKWVFVCVFLAWLVIPFAWLVNALAYSTFHPVPPLFPPVVSEDEQRRLLWITLAQVAEFFVTIFAIYVILLEVWYRWLKDALRRRGWVE
jgi:hypothetical protein